MISTITSEALIRLTKGKFRLDKAALSKLIAEVKVAPQDELLLAAFPPKKKTARKSTPPKPDWLKDILKVQKKLAWKAPEAKAKLYELAEKAGFNSTGAKQRSIPKAAEEIAKQIGGPHLRDIFSEWVNDFSKSHQLT